MSFSFSMILILVTVVISYAGFRNQILIDRFKHSPYAEWHGKEYVRLLSSGFLHGGTGHLLINMFVLFQFGPYVEYLLGYRYGSITGTILFFVFYLSAVITANLGTFFKEKNNPGFNSIGASGATSALVVVFSLLDPWQMFLFPPVPSFLFAILYLGYSHWASSRNRDQIDHTAHFWGALYGILFILIAVPESLQIFLSRIVQDAPF